MKIKKILLPKQKFLYWLVKCKKATTQKERRCRLFVAFNLISEATSECFIATIRTARAQELQFSD